MAPFNNKELRMSFCLGYYLVFSFSELSVCQYLPRGFSLSKSVEPGTNFPPALFNSLFSTPFAINTSCNYPYHKQG